MQKVPGSTFRNWAFVEWLLDLQSREIGISWENANILLSLENVNEVTEKISMAWRVSMSFRIKGNGVSLFYHESLTVYHFPKGCRGMKYTLKIFKNLPKIGRT